MIIYNASTKRGQDIIARGSRYDGVYLHQVYDKWSADKQKAWDDNWEKYINTDEHSSFSICSHNPNAFTLSWLGKKDGEDVLFYITAWNDYMVYLNR